MQEVKRNINSSSSSRTHRCPRQQDHGQAIQPGQPHLSPLETDVLIRQSCSALFEMCCQRLPCVIQKLLQKLASPSHPFTSDEQTGLVNHLRTQLFVIKILRYCMSYHWAWHREQLNDNLAKQLVATISFFLKEHQRFEDASAALGPIGSTCQEPDEKPILPSLMGDILTQVSKIRFFVSASNWTIVLGKIKNWIAYWSGPEEFPDRSETRLLEFCSLNRHRLSSIVRELSAQFVHLKRAAQSDIALALRRSIWNWIETYPNEYASLVRSNGRLEGAPDVLFDVAHGLSENGKKRAYTWPTMPMLLAITVGDRNRSQVTARKAAFIESLRKHLKAVKMTDVATACCVDLCKAATFSPKMTAEGPGLRLLALDLVGDLNSRLLDPSKPFTNSEGVVEIPLMSSSASSRSTPPVLRLCGLDASLSAAQLSATLQGLPDNGKGLGGRVAQAKRAKLVMRTIASNSPIIDPLWDEALRRWKLLSSLVGHRPFEDSSGDPGMYDCAPALGAIAGKGVLHLRPPHLHRLPPRPLASQTPPAPLDHFIPPDLLHDRFYALPDRARNVDRYIQEMVDLLVADDLRMREGVKDALGTELHTALFPILLKHLKSIVAHFFEHERAKPQSPFSHFIEQAISMLRLFFERIVEPLAEPVAERVAALLIDFTRYTNRLGCLGSDFGPIATRIKYKMAQLAEVIVACNKERAAPLVTSTVLKNQMIDYFLAWATSVNMVLCISAEEASRQRANRDLSIACLKALAAFYDRLKLVPRHALLRGNHTANNEVVHVRLFSRHYDYLSFLLTEVTKLEVVAVRSCKGKMAAGGGTKGGGGGTLEHAAALQRELASITREIVELAGFRGQTINCLVKLMAANIDPAFRYFVNMFHHPDNRIKQANIHILWEVVKEGLPELVKPVRATGLDKIVDIITRPDLTLACGSADFEEMTEVILNIFDYHKGVIKFLKASIEREVAATDHESTVFRGNLFTTRLLTIFARAQGYNYLRATLSNLLVGLVNKPSEFLVNFDPHRASAEEDEAARNLEQVTEAFLNVIAVSWKKLPGAICEICHHFATTVQEKYPESVFTSIGGFIFLRFINPAIVSPEVIDLDLPNNTREIRRSLVMITKVLQALSNNIRFSARKPAMKPLNPFMAKKVYPMTRFLKDISLIDEPGMLAEEGCDLQEELAAVPLDASDRHVLHRFLYEHQEKLGAELKSVQPMEFKHWHDGTKRLSPTLGHELWAEVLPSSPCPPPRPPRSPSSPGSRNSATVSSVPVRSTNMPATASKTSCADSSNSPCVNKNSKACCMAAYGPPWPARNPSCR
ncbi:hypothetical protein PtB15_12B577 [Puccinia triticina]|nr:hypothetical protein PtB15_12B577 [Puccinia triticina]